MRACKCQYAVLHLNKSFGAPWRFDQTTEAATMPTRTPEEIIGHDYLLALLADGYAIVPVEATAGMVAYARHRNPEVSIDLAKGVWRCMIDEATKHPTGAQ